MRKFALIALALAAGMAQAADRVQVSFAETDKFADFGRSQWDRERNQKDFAAMLQDVAAKLPANQQLSIKVLDVNLAGELEWVRRYADELRVMRNVSWPMIEFEYQLSENGQVLKADKVRLTDMSYLQDSFFTVGQTSGAWRYEQRMLDRWFKETVLGKKR